MKNPTCWLDVVRCACNSCVALTQIYNRCCETREPLYVQDCRMFGQPHPWGVADIRSVFVSPCPEENKYLTRKAAVEAVLSVQSHCDVFESSFPLLFNGETDFRWGVTTGRQDTGWETYRDSQIEAGIWPPYFREIKALRPSNS